MYKLENKPEIFDFTNAQLKAFIDLLLYTVNLTSNEEDVEDIFATERTGQEIFGKTMTREHLQILLVALRFDNPDGRKQRKIDNFTRVVVKRIRPYTRFMPMAVLMRC